MTERELFLSALEIEDQGVREAWLKAACAGEAALLARVESLLASLKLDQRFLQVPLLEQLGKTSDAGEIATLFMGSASTVDHAAVDGNAPTGILHDPSSEPAGRGSGEISLDFLQPSDKPSSLGRLGHYEIQEILGHGAFGTVFRALDDKLQRVVAIKVLAPDLASTSTARKRFLREAQAAAAVRHENVVSIHGVEEAPIPHLVMEYVPGTTLQKRLEEQGPFDLCEVLRIGTQIAEGLSAAHARGLVHRDIKPGNILLESGPRERVKITDFGLARAADDASVTQTGIIAGTPMFMAPEQARGEKLDQRSDLFSFGSVLYQMVTGQSPFRAPTSLAALRRVAEEMPRPIQEIVPAAPTWLCWIISRLHAKNPAERYQSSEEVAVLLARCRDEIAKHGRAHLVAGITPIAVTHPRQNRPPRWRMERVVAAVALLTLLGLSLAEASGFTNLQSTVLRLFSREGTLVVEVDDPDVSVTIDEGNLVIKGAGVKELRVDSGRHMVQAVRDGKVLRQEVVSIEKNGRKIVKITAEPTPSEEAVDTETSEWERSVAGLSGVEQATAVTARLKKLNPRYDGKFKPGIEEGRVRALDLNTHFVSDISPLRVLKDLKHLNLHGDLDGDSSRHGELSDLSPLRGLALESLYCICSPVFDLSPLKGMPLKAINVERTSVSDLGPLQGMPLTSVNFYICPVSDLTPLKGMRLTFLMAIGSRVSDLTPLQGMPLNILYLTGTPVSDLTPLRGMPLSIIWCGNTKVTSLAPLEGLPLQHLGCDSTEVSDLSPLAGMSLTGLSCQKTLVKDHAALAKLPLKALNLSFDAGRDAEILRAISTLETINQKPVAEFWKEVAEKN